MTGCQHADLSPSPVSSGISARHLSVAAGQPPGLLPDYGAPAATDALSAKAAGTTPASGTPGANSYRAYPPSCAAYPLPDKPTGPTYSATISALANPIISASSGIFFSSSETLTVTVWRLPCSSSGAPVPYNSSGAQNAITLVRLDRADDSVTTTLPMMPLLLVSQGSIDFTSAKSYVRLASEPNSVLSDRRYGNPYDLFKTSTTYALENYPSADAGHFNFNEAFTLRAAGGTGSAVDISVPAYAPTSETYPGAGAPMPFDGYAAKQWIADNQGLLMQVTEQQDARGVTFRQLVTDLEIQNPGGSSEWLFANQTFPTGATSVTANLNYRVDAQTLKPWGTAEYVLVDCNHLDVTYTPSADLPADAPAQDLSGTMFATIPDAFVQRIHRAAETFTRANMEFTLAINPKDAEILIPALRGDEMFKDIRVNEDHALPSGGFKITARDLEVEDFPQLLGAGDDE